MSSIPDDTLLDDSTNFILQKDKEFGPCVRGVWDAKTSIVRQLTLDEQRQAVEMGLYIAPLQDLTSLKFPWSKTRSPCNVQRKEVEQFLRASLVRSGDKVTVPDEKTVEEAGQLLSVLDPEVFCLLRCNTGLIRQKLLEQSLKEFIDLFDKVKGIKAQISFTDKEIDKFVQDAEVHLHEILNDSLIAEGDWMNVTPEDNTTEPKDLVPQKVESKETKHSVTSSKMLQDLQDILKIRYIPSDDLQLVSILRQFTQIPGDVIDYLFFTCSGFLMDRGHFYEIVNMAHTCFKEGKMNTTTESTLVCAIRDHIIQVRSGLLKRPTRGIIPPILTLTHQKFVPCKMLQDLQAILKIEYTPSNSVQLVSIAQRFVLIPGQVVDYLFYSCTKLLLNRGFFYEAIRTARSCFLQCKIDKAIELTLLHAIEEFIENNKNVTLTPAATLESKIPTTKANHSPVDTTVSHDVGMTGIQLSHLLDIFKVKSIKSRCESFLQPKLKYFSVAAIEYLFDIREFIKEPRIVEELDALYAVLSQADSKQIAQKEVSLWIELGLVIRKCKDDAKYKQSLTLFSIQPITGGWRVTLGIEQEIKIDMKALPEHMRLPIGISIAQDLLLERVPILPPEFTQYLFDCYPCIANSDLNAATGRLINIVCNDGYAPNKLQEEIAHIAYEWLKQAPAPAPKSIISHNNREWRKVFKLEDFLPRITSTGVVDTIGASAKPFSFNDLISRWVKNISGSI